MTCPTAPTTRTKPSIHLVVTALTIAALTTLAALFTSSGATAGAADPGTLYVNSTGFTTATTGCTPGVDQYDPAKPTNNTCTLRAALTYANANSTPANPLTVTLATDFAAAGGGEIAANNTTANFMTTAAVNNATTGNGAFYVISAPMTVDLQNKLSISRAAPASGLPFTSIYINGTGISLLNASGIQGGYTSIAVSGSSNGVLINGGTTQPTVHGYYVRQFLVVQNGAQNVTFQNYTLGNFYYTAGTTNCEGAMVCFTDNGQAGHVTSDTTISNVDFTNLGTSTTCSSTNSTGCAASGIMFARAANVNGLTVTGSRFSNINGHANGYVMSSYQATSGSLRLAGIDFSGNLVTNNANNTAVGADTSGLVTFVNTTTSTFSGFNRIRNNTFTNPTSLKQPHAITINLGNTNTSHNTTPSCLHIEDNSFDGFTGPAIWLNAAGLVTVQRNTFGPNQFSNPSTTAEETAGNGNTGTAGAMFVNNGLATNQNINTWHPTAAVINHACEVAVSATAPTANVPALPVRLDVFHTASTKAEKFLGSTTPSIDSSPATFTVPLPASLLNADGSASGYLRLQTHSAGLSATQLASSQYSRTVVITGRCLNLSATSIAPQRGGVAGGETLTISGSGFTKLGDVVPNVTLGSKKCAAVAVVDDATLTCVVPAHLAGLVAVEMVVGGQTVLRTDYLYHTSPELTIVKRAWTGVPDGAAHDDIVSGQTGAAEAPVGAAVPSGTRLTWTYTVTSIEAGANPAIGADASLGQGSFDIVVVDDILGPVCTIASLAPNTSAGCLATGKVA